MQTETQTLVTLIFGCAMIFGFSDYGFMREKNDPVSSFTQSDFASFDRDFSIDGKPCEVGIESDRLCFASSPMIEKISLGKPLPQVVPQMPARFPVIRVTDLKYPHLDTHRFGQTLVLIDTETGKVVDKLNLTEPTQLVASGLDSSANLEN
ncbi:MAG: hypothetical protein AAGH90_02690 [Pseudomonadota bacterium]